MTPFSLVAAGLRRLEGVAWRGDSLALGGYLVGPEGVSAVVSGPDGETVEPVFRWDEYASYESPPDKRVTSLRVRLREGRVVDLRLTTRQVFTLVQSLRKVDWFYARPARLAMEPGSLSGDARRAVRLSVDAARLVLRTSGPATGGIAVALGEVVFPAEGWDDFVLVILEAWLTALVRLVRGVSVAERVHFMEGRYAIDLLRLDTGAIQLRAVERPDRLRGAVEAMPLALVENARTVAEGVLAVCRQQGHRSTDFDRLEAALEALGQVALELRARGARGPGSAPAG